MPTSSRGTRTAASGVAVAAVAFGLFTAGTTAAHAAGGETLICAKDGVSLIASDRDGQHGGYPTANRTWAATIADASKYNGGIFQVVPKTSGTLNWTNSRTGAHGSLSSSTGDYADIDTGTGPIRLTTDTTVKWGWGYTNTAHVRCSGTYNR